jgi:hypothetical protein
MEMGSHDCWKTFRATSRDDAAKQAKEFQRQEQHENGHGAYTGHLGTAGIGVQFCAKTFVDEMAAQNWILDNHDKWDAPYLVKIDGGDMWLLGGWCSS